MIKVEQVLISVQMRICFRSYFSFSIIIRDVFFGSGKIIYNRGDHYPILSEVCLRIESVQGIGFGEMDFFQSLMNRVYCGNAVFKS